MHIAIWAKDQIYITIYEKQCINMSHTQLSGRLNSHADFFGNVDSRSIVSKDIHGKLSMMS